MAKSCIGGFSLFNYVIDQEKGYELIRNNLCGESPIEIMQEIKIIQNLNQKATNKLLSMVLSPHINDGEHLSKKELREITKEFLKELEIDSERAQFIAFVHTEKKHRHVHILINRVKEDSRLIPDHHIGKKAQWAAHRVAENNELISAKQVRISNIIEAETIKANAKQFRKEIYQKHNLVISTKPKSMEEYLSKMFKNGIDFIPIINKQGFLQGFRVKDIESQIDMKASDIHRSMSIKGLLDLGLPFENPNISLHNSLVLSQEKACNKKSNDDDRLRNETLEVVDKEIRNSFKTQKIDREIDNLLSINPVNEEESSNIPKRKYKRR